MRPRAPLKRRPVSGLCRPHRMYFLAEAHGPQCPLPPVCGLIPGIVLVVEMSELSKPKEDHQDPGEAQGPEEAQLLGAEAWEAASATASSLQVSCSALAEALPRKL